LDPDAADKLTYLAKSERKSVSEIIRAAIERYYDQARANHAAAAGVLERNGFIGCAVGEPDLSTTYKRGLADALRRKHGHR
jgi:hypothetical protein